MAQPQVDVTQLLLDWESGDDQALAQLTSRLYRELHRRAEGFLRRERPGHTLQPTALVNEAYLRLVDQRRVRWRNRSQFFGVAASLMRRILVDHARKRRAAKRGSGQSALPLDEAQILSWARDVDLESLDDALRELASFAPRQAKVVELRFFGGLSVADTAEVLTVSPASVKLDWQKAKAWLYRQVVEDEG